jgi:hypothetical protein
MKDEMQSTYISPAKAVNLGNSSRSWLLRASYVFLERFNSSWVYKNVQKVNFKIQLALLCKNEKVAVAKNLP